MVTKKFTCKMHEDNGYLGWVMNTMPHFDPALGMQVAHDCMEHLTRRPGFEGEMEAFGVALYIRHGGGYWQETLQKDPSWSNNVSTELAEFLARDTDNLTVAVAPRTRLLDDEDAEEQIAMMKLAAFDAFYDEWAECYDYAGTPGEVVTLALERSAVWIRRGWLNAQRKYKAFQYDLAYMFRQIEKEVDALSPSEGDSLTIRFDRDNTNYEVIHKPLYNW